MSLRASAALAGIAGVVLAGACVFSTHGTLEAGAGGSAATSTHASTGTTTKPGTGTGGSTSSGTGASSSGMGGSVEQRCANTVKDGSETDVDCGGECKPCTGGHTCQQGSDCDNGFCVEGICCDTACQELCRTCNGNDNGGKSGVCSKANAGLDPGARCSGQGLGTCDEGGACRCKNGMRDGAETDVDCGGPDCQKCGDGHACSGNGDCGSGHCIGGICCNTDCTGPCHACNLAPHWVGRCVPVFSGEKGGCPSGQGCTPSHTCGGGKANDAGCSSNNQCISASCATGYDNKCHPRGPAGDPCTSQYNCQSGTCGADHLCQ